MSAGMADAAPSNVLMVEGLPAALSTDTAFLDGLRAVFSSFGEVEEMEVQQTTAVLRVVFVLREAAVLAMARLAGKSVSGQPVTLTYGPNQRVEDKTKDWLQVPPAPKQFLISPPSSPPIGWEPVEEDPPVINQELLDALANIDKLVNREILAAQDNTPAINVCDCSDTPPSEDQLPPPPQPGNLAAFGASRGMAGRGQMPSAPAWLQNTQHTIHGWLQHLRHP